MNRNDIEELCSMFVDWIQGVTYKDRAYMLLFLLGKDINPSNVKWMLNAPDKAWIKALFTNRHCAEDSYIRAKIRELIRHKIDNGCMGEILVKGNFQTLAVDPYGLMEWICGKPPVGILKEKEYYSNYWIQKGIDLVDSMRSPMTYRSEHVLAPLVRNEKIDKWFRYLNTTFIISMYGTDCVRYAGADADRL